MGILFLAVFTLELEMDYPSETSLCTVTPSPQTPLLQFFLRGGGGCTQATYLGAGYMIPRKLKPSETLKIRHNFASAR